VNHIRFLTNVELTIIDCNGETKTKKAISSSYMKALSFQEGEDPDCIDVTLPDGSIIPGLERSTFSIHGPATILPRNYQGESPFADFPVEPEPVAEDDEETFEFDELDYPRGDEDDDDYFTSDDPHVSG
jgi:hypothetical protein